MWQLKFIQEHKDCIYSRKIKELNLVMYGYPLNHFYDKKRLYVTNIQILKGSSANIKKYVNYLKKRKEIVNFEEITQNTFSFQIRLAKNYSYYRIIYNNEIFYPEPIIHKEGKETITVSSWDRKKLEKLMVNVQNNKNTLYFKLLHFKQNPLNKLNLLQVLPNLTANQFDIIKLAKEKGYWNYPKKISISKLAQNLNKSKSTVHETLRRAEAKLMDYYI